MGEPQRARPSAHTDWLEAQRLAQSIPHWRHPDHRAAVNRWAQAVLAALKRGHASIPEPDLFIGSVT